MKITIIHGQNHKGSTYQIANILAKKLEGEVKEFFLPKDFNQFCTGCTMCFMKGESKCPHFELLSPITAAMDGADVLIFASPVYVYHITGPMKTFLDHYGYRWMVHRPNESMFKKQAICIATAAGAGMKSTNKDIADSMFYWGVGKTYQYGVAVRAITYKDIPEKIKSKIETKTTILAKKIRKRNGSIRPGLKTKIFFNIMRQLVKKGWNEEDNIYWEEKGWTGKNRPW